MHLLLCAQNYHPPSSHDIPEDLRTSFYNSRNNPNGVLGSKATGEPSVLMGVGVMFAIRRALDAAKRDAGGFDPRNWYQLGKWLVFSCVLSQLTFIRPPLPRWPSYSGAHADDQRRHFRSVYSTVISRYKTSFPLCTHLKSSTSNKYTIKHLCTCINTHLLSGPLFPCPSSHWCLYLSTERGKDVDNDGLWPSFYVRNYQCRATFVTWLRFLRNMLRTTYAQFSCEWRSFFFWPSIFRPERSRPPCSLRRSSPLPSQRRRSRRPAPRLSWTCWPCPPCPGR